MEEEEEAVGGGEVVEKGMRGQTENRRWEDGESFRKSFRKIIYRLKG